MNDECYFAAIVHQVNAERDSSRDIAQVGGPDLGIFLQIGRLPFAYDLSRL